MCWLQLRLGNRFICKEYVFSVNDAAVARCVHMYLGRVLGWPYTLRVVIASLPARVDSTRVGMQTFNSLVLDASQNILCSWCSKDSFICRTFQIC